MRGVLVLPESVMGDTEAWEYGDIRGSVLPGLGWVCLLSVILDHCSLLAPGIQNRANDSTLFKITNYLLSQRE